VNVTDFNLVENKNFNNLPVNLTMSTVHVPTSLYDRCRFYVIRNSSHVCIFSILCWLTLVIFRLLRCIFLLFRVVSLEPLKRSPSQLHNFQDYFPGRGPGQD